VYDIQTAYKGAVYSVKLKMEFTILNQLMNLVKGNLADGATSSPHTHSKSRVTNRSSMRPVNKELGHSAGAYSRMDEDSIHHSPSNGDIKLRDLKTNDVLKTTTTEVKFEDVSISSVESGRKRSRSGSSEVYIIDKNRT
jgi:hypothetical protein